MNKVSFPQEVADKALVACGRCCCICHKFSGTKMELHHIKQKAYGGEDTFENCIPLCLDCHADMGKADPKHPKGKRYTEAELLAHRDSWYKKVSTLEVLSSQEISASDRELFKKICDAFSGEVQRWLIYEDLRGIHPTNVFQPLDRLLYEENDPFFEFLDYEMEKFRAVLFDSIRVFIQYSAFNTFPIGPDLPEYSAPHIWLMEKGYIPMADVDYQKFYDENYKKFESEGKKLNALATRVWNCYCEFVRLSRRILNE